jgi:signal transduction histidine kinase
MPLEENISTVIKELTPLSDKKGIKIDYFRLKDDVVIQADASKLKEVLINLVGNAIKYTLDNGGIEISHEISGDEVITRIKDHGIGIDEESLKKLFSKFYRVKTDKTENIDGTGLGLFICKEIVERMGGRIWVESKTGDGSTFFFSLKKA